MPTRTLLSLAGLALLSSAVWSAAEAARCYTTDDGEYDCTFRATDGNGSFEISAPGKPTFGLVIDAPGVAFGFADFGSGNVSLPGRYLRSQTDRACWVSDATDTRICAW